jgi:hypothetical protein
MKVKLVLKSLDGMPEALSECYEKRDDGNFYLMAEGLPELEAMKTKVTEFRENNIKLLKENDQLKADLGKFKDVNLDEYTDLRTKKKLFDENKMYDDNKIEELVQSRTGRMRGDFENQIAALQKAGNEKEAILKLLHNELAKEKIDNEIQKHVTSVAVPAKGAMEDIIRCGRAVFTMNENRLPVALDANGHVIPGKDGVTPLSISEWAAELPKTKSHFFMPSDGMGSGGGDRNGGGGNGIDYSKMNAVERLKTYRENEHRQQRRSI